MSNAWFSPASGAINEMDTVLNNFDGARLQDRYKEIDQSVIDEPPAARSLAIATASGAPIQRLSEHLLFAIFDFVRDGHAFLQCETSCVVFCNLLQSPNGAGRRLWEARPIRYGSKTPISMPHDPNLSYRRPPEHFLKDGGRRVVLECAACRRFTRKDSYSIVVHMFVQDAAWTQLVADIYARCRPETGPLPRLALTSRLVGAATEVVESWTMKLLSRALMCAVHRGSTTITAADIELARALMDDRTFQTYRGDLHVSRARLSPPGRGPKKRFSVDALPSIPVAAKEAIIRTLVRRVRGTAYTGRAYELLWVLILARLLKLLKGVGLLVLYSKGPKEVVTDAESRELVLQPDLKDLAYVLKSDGDDRVYFFCAYIDEVDEYYDEEADDDSSIGTLSDLSTFDNEGDAARDVAAQAQARLDRSLARRHCDTCGRQAAISERPFPVCDACGRRRYCSRNCQRVDWVAHKHSCPGVAQLMEDMSLS